MVKLASNLIVKRVGRLAKRAVGYYFFRNLIRKMFKVGNVNVKPLAHAIRINDWKREYIRERYKEYEWKFYSFKSSSNDVFSEIKCNSDRDNIIIVWGYNEPAGMADIAFSKKIPIYRMEDGFVRSVELGANHNLPLSLVIDKSGYLYFDSRNESYLEKLLNNYDFDSHQSLMLEAKQKIEKIVSLGVSKYNHVQQRSGLDVYNQLCQPEEGKKRILVIGQVESDASITFGCEKPLTNGGLVWQARRENPEAQIFFKPHPDTLAGKRKLVSSLDDIAKIAFVVSEPLALVNAFESIDEVYTITSLGGFEALLHGLKVTTLGSPFYSGWGLTRDLQTNHRRKRTLTVEQVFAAAYILYPDYFDPYTPERSCLDNIIDVLSLNNKHAKPDLKDKKQKTAVTKIKPVDPRPIAHGLRVNDWKRDFIKQRYPQYDWVFYRFKTTTASLLKEIEKQDKREHRIIVWGYNEPADLVEQAKELAIPLYRMEDGFVRSVGLGANHELPMSLVLDKSGSLYFDARQASHLENILNTYDFANDQALINQASDAIKVIKSKGISKYNHVGRSSALSVYAKYCSYDENTKRILVIGQVESDASIKYGSDRPLNNGALVWQAKRENPDAQIFFKPHPDTLAGKRELVTPLEEIAKIAHVVTENLALSDSFETIDEVYTITSLSGFEALLRGLKVTTLGCPFYSGWGLTRDLQINERRGRKLSIEEVFAGAYILYPDYFDPYMPEKTSLNNVIDALSLNTASPRALGDKQAENQSNLIAVNTPTKPIAHGLRVNEWKRSYIEQRYPEYDWVFYPFKTKSLDIVKEIQKQADREHRIIIWGYKEPADLVEQAKQLSIPIYRMEDGFVRSVGLGSNHELPLSLVLDKSGTLYFDARTPSSLETILNSYKFAEDKALLEQAEIAMNALTAKGVSKYNHVQKSSALTTYGKYASYSPLRKRILVIGQVESDASIKYGADRPLNNGALVWEARKNNPDADIFFKPHPDTLEGNRDISTPLELIRKFAYVVADPLSISDAFDTIDEVYTISSLAGFEALLRGKKVTTLGCPFYSGWGLTNDIQKNPRRSRTLTLTELFAGAYILYPDYFEPFSTGKSDVLSTITLVNLVANDALTKEPEVVDKKVYDHRKNTPYSSFNEFNSVA
ncbi:hypothetical protein OAG1_28460 [Agarivorans sp. OAG1]|uniref:capsular polysaccharide export protein, LipB/KpsS family n=1 Tax=Agarivorans sp. OAG1 TaxID=3082387 RepID=UPI002B2AA73F|nr:hypothetical protein OAG1_28460 [Agarivorans sp. OAG1]